MNKPDIEIKDLEQKARDGNATAQKNLGVIHYYGKGVEQDDTKAFEWFEKAAQQGDANAQCDLGTMYYNGDGVQQDDNKAFEWYSNAARQGLKQAFNDLRQICLALTEKAIKPLNTGALFEAAALGESRNNLALAAAIVTLLGSYAEQQPTNAGPKYDRS